MLQGSEAGEQKAVIEWSLMYDKLKWLHAIPNGAFLAGDKKRRAAQMAKLKSQGLKVGVLDLFLPVVMPPYHGLYIEMKRPDGKGKLTQEQKDFRDHCEMQGYKVLKCDTAGEAICGIQTYMRMK